MVAWATLPPKPAAWQLSTIPPHSPLIGHKILLLLPEEWSLWHLFKHPPFFLTWIFPTASWQVSLPLISVHFNYLQTAARVSFQQSKYDYGSPLLNCHQLPPSSQERPNLTGCRSKGCHLVKANILSPSAHHSACGHVSMLQVARHHLWWLWRPFCFDSGVLLSRKPSLQSLLHSDLNEDSFYRLQQRLYLPVSKAYIRHSDDLTLSSPLDCELFESKECLLPLKPHIEWGIEECWIKPCQMSEWRVCSSIS